MQTILSTNYDKGFGIGNYSVMWLNAPSNLKGCHPHDFTLTTKGIKKLNSMQQLSVCQEYTI